MPTISRWKLALVVKGRADPALLDTYEQERMPVARRLLLSTDRAFQLIVSDTWLAGLFRTRIMARLAARAMTFERVRKLAFRTLSQIGISYPQSVLTQGQSGLPKEAPAPGDRFPWMRLKFQPGAAAEDVFEKLDDLTCNLVVIGQAGPRTDALGPFADVVRTHTIPADPANAAELARAQVPVPSFYFLRPDGHVGLCGAKLEMDAVTNYLTGRMNLRT